MKLSLTAACLLLASLSTAPAAPCRDSSGKFVKCPDPAAPAAVTKDANGKCHVAAGPKKGQFTRCPA